MFRFCRNRETLKIDLKRKFYEMERNRDITDYFYHIWSNGLVVKGLRFQSRGPMFKTSG